jgi:hypothetical protein
VGELIEFIILRLQASDQGCHPAWDLTEKTTLGVIKRHPEGDLNPRDPSSVSARNPYRPWANPIPLWDIVPIYV